MSSSGWRGRLQCRVRKSFELNHQAFEFAQVRTLLAKLDSTSMCTGTGYRDIHSNSQDLGRFWISRWHTLSSSMVKVQLNVRRPWIWQPHTTTIHTGNSGGFLSLPQPGVWTASNLEFQAKLLEAAAFIPAFLGRGTRKKFNPRGPSKRPLHERYLLANKHDSLVGTSTCPAFISK